ncbi:MAG: hypothetical protein AAF228_10665 [Pseudomonadota bacterium]
MTASDDTTNETEPSNEEVLFENETEKEDRQLRERLAKLSGNKDHEGARDPYPQDSSENFSNTTESIEEAFLALIQSEEHQNENYSLTDAPLPDATVSELSTPDEPSPILGSSKDVKEDSQNNIDHFEGFSDVKPEVRSEGAQAPIKQFNTPKHDISKQQEHSSEVLGKSSVGVPTKTDHSLNPAPLANKDVVNDTSSENSVRSEKQNATDLTSTAHETHLPKTDFPSVKNSKNEPVLLKSQKSEKIHNLEHAENLLQSENVQEVDQNPSIDLNVNKTVQDVNDLHSFDENNHIAAQHEPSQDITPTLRLNTSASKQNAYSTDTLEQKIVQSNFETNISSHEQDYNGHRQDYSDAKDNIFNADMHAEQILKELQKPSLNDIDHYGKQDQFALSSRSSVQQDYFEEDEDVSDQTSYESYHRTFKGAQTHADYRPAKPSQEQESLESLREAISATKAQEDYADPEFQALVQWSRTEAKPEAPKEDSEAMPNFLAKKKSSGLRLNFKTSFLTAVILTAVLGMFYVVYQSGQNKGEFVASTQGTNDTENFVFEETIAQNQDPSAQEGQVAQNRSINNESTESAPQQTIQIQPEQRTGIQTAQSKPPVQPQILEFIVEDLSGTAGRNIPMNIRLVGTNLGLETTLLFRGIPNELALTSGIKREGIWSVAASQLNDLALTVPDDFDGKFNFEVFAFPNRETKPERRLASVSVDSLSKPELQPENPTSLQNITTAPSSLASGYINKLPQTSSINQNPKITIEPANQPVVQDTPAQQQEQRQAAIAQEKSEPPKPQISRSLETSMLRRANLLLKDGDVAGARLLFEHLATQRSKHAAFALARTYDKAFLDKMYVRGLEPDHATAIRWYREAVKLGHNDAATRLSQLEGRR